MLLRGDVVGLSGFDFIVEISNGFVFAAKA